MGVQNRCPFTISKTLKSLRAGSINAGAAMQVLDGKSVTLQAFTDFTDFIKHGHNTAKFVAEKSQHLINQHLCPAHAQRMDHMTDRGTIVNRSNAKM